MLFAVLLSVIVHLSLLGGDCKLALPVLGLPPALADARTRLSSALCSNVKVLPCMVILPLPVYVVPAQQKR